MDHDKTDSPYHLHRQAYQKNELGKPFSLKDHQREILRLPSTSIRMAGCRGIPILYSCVKKSGKTAINTALILTWALTQEAPNEILILTCVNGQGGWRVL